MNTHERIDLNSNCVIEASAGTGKTFTIEKIFLDLILGVNTKSLRASEIIVLTYTDSASRELKERISVRLKAEYNKSEGYQRSLISRALEDIEFSDISTIHGFAKRILDDFFFETSFLPNLNVADDNKWLSSKALEIALKEIKDPDIFTILDKHFKGINHICNIIQELTEKSFFQSQDLLEAMKINFVPDIHILESILKGEYRQTQVEEAERIITEITDRWPFSSDITEFLMKAYRKPTASAKAKQWHSLNGEDDLLKKIEQISKLYKNLKGRIKTESLEDDEKMLLKLMKNSADKWQIINSQKTLMEKSKGWLAIIEIGRVVNKQLLRHKIQNNLISFDDMIYRVSAILKDSRNSSLKNKLSEKYKVLLLDEFQDTDRWQWQIFKEIFSASPSHRVFLVGDPKQSIYRFRNADLDIYEAAVKEVKNKFVLDRNYRARPVMTETVNKLLESGQLIFSDNHSSFNPVKPVSFNQWSIIEKDHEIAPLEFFDISKEDDTKDNAFQAFINNTLKKIQSFLSPLSLFKIQSEATREFRKIKAGDIAILTRDRKSAAAAAAVLQNNNIPVTINNKTPIFKSFEAKAIIALIQSIANPENMMLLKKNQLYGFIPEEEKYTLSDANLTAAFKRKIWGFHNIFHQRGLQFLLRHIENQLNLKETMLRNQKEDSLLIIREIFRIMVEWNQDDKLFTLDQLAEKAYEESKNEHSEYVPPLQLSGEAVTITTMHASKGLGFPIVFIAAFKSNRNLSRNLLKSCHNNNHKIIELYDYNNTNEIKIRELQEEQNEQNRLIYVAMTRARSYMAFPLVRNNKNYSSLTDSLWSNHTERDDWININNNICSVISADKIPDINEQVLISEGTENEELIPNRTFENPEKLSAEKNLSFTSLAGTHDLEESVPKTNIYSEMQKKNTSQSLLPGAESGKLLHEFLEHLNFNSMLTIKSIEEYSEMFEKSTQLSIFKKLIAKYGFTDHVKDELIKILFNVLKTEINVGGFEFQLASLQEKIHELEFIMPLKTEGWKNFISTLPSNCKSELKLYFNKGWLKGFIDLIFKVEGKWYIADWKSNYLGSAPEDYQSENLEKSIRSHQYHLQYNIYTTALIRYLKKYSENFSYDDHFGGVLYLYLRGMQTGSSNGIYYCKPPYKEILDLEQMISGET